MDRRYRFWLEMDSGERIEWGGLSARQAREMYTRTRVWHPRGVRIFGWGSYAEPHLDAVGYREPRAD